MTTLWWVPSLLIAVLLGAGVGGSFSGVLTPESGFQVFGAGLALAALALPGFAGAGAFASATGKPWRSMAVQAAVIPLLAVLFIVLPNASRVSPPIHDITTDPDDSLAFAPDVAALPNAAVSQPMARDQVLAMQRERYPDLGPLELSLQPDAAFRAALGVAEATSGWEVNERNSARGEIRVVATSRLFRFVDDVLIRVQPAAALDEPGRSRIDVRSRSRFGQSDLGANAQRILDYFERLRQVSAP